MQPRVRVWEKPRSRCYPIFIFSYSYSFSSSHSVSEVLNPLQSGPEFTPWDLARTSDHERNAMGQSTEMSPLVSMLFRTFLNPLKFLKKIFNIL